MESEEDSKLKEDGRVERARLRLLGGILEVGDEVVTVLLLLETWREGKGKEKRDREEKISMVFARQGASKMVFDLPANAILVPGMYFFGFSRYSNMVSWSL